MLIFVISIKTLASIISLFYWQVYHITGSRFETFSFLNRFFFALSEINLLLYVFIISSGWKIIHSQFNWSRIRYLVFGTALLLINVLFFSLYSQTYYSISLLLISILMAPKILPQLGKTIHLLRYHALLYRSSNFQNDLIDLKKSYLKKLRIYLIFYFFLTFVSNIAGAINFWNFQPLAILVKDFISLLIVLIISWSLRPRFNGISNNNEDLNDLRSFQSLIKSYPQINECVFDISKTIVIEWPALQNFSIAFAN